MRARLLLDRRQGGGSDTAREAVMTSRKTLDLAANGKEPDWSSGSLFFVGTATVVLDYAGFTILTDPNFLHAGDHVHLGYGLRSRRLTNPALELDQLPPIDFVLLSHLHGDHFDQVVERRLDKTLPIVTTRHAAHGLARKGFRATHALGTWDSLVVTKGDARVIVTSLPGKHGPGPMQALLPPVMGSLLEFTSIDGPAMRLYVSGDTLVHEALHEIPRRFPDIDLGLFHLGGTRLFGVLLTMDARQGVEAVRIVNPDIAVPIHYDDYPVFKSPLDDFKRAVQEAGLESRVRYVERGESLAFQVPESRRPRPLTAGVGRR
jgi:L-ascorbate metabolism protein UlaG (beta-lactamase superfamily)